MPHRCRRCCKVTQVTFPEVSLISDQLQRQENNPDLLAFKAQRNPLFSHVPPPAGLTAQPRPPGVAGPAALEVDRTCTNMVAAASEGLGVEPNKPCNHQKYLPLWFQMQGQRSCVPFTAQAPPPLPEVYMCKYGLGFLYYLKMCM